MEIPDKIFFKIGEVSDVAGVKPYVLRYWESEFSIVPHKSSSGQRLYRRKDIERILLIKRLLYAEGYTIAGARKYLARSGRAGIDSLPDESGNDSEATSDATLDAVSADDGGEEAGLEGVGDGSGESVEALVESAFQEQLEADVDSESASSDSRSDVGWLAAMKEEARALLEMVRAARSLKV